MAEKPADFFRTLKKEIEANGKIEQEILHTIIAVEAERHFLDNFRKEGFEDEAFQPWPKRKVENKSTKGRRLLVKTGTLRRHIKGRVVGRRVEFRFPLPYEKLHNEGGKVEGTQNVKAHSRKAPKGTSKDKKLKIVGEDGKSRVSNRISVKAHTRKVNFTMPKRQFVGESKVLNEKIRKKVEQYLDRKLKTL